MERRIISVFFLFALFMGLLSVQILLISTGETTAAARNSNTKTVVLAESRGIIYDCNGLPLTDTETERRAVVPPTDNVLHSLQSILSPEQFKTAQSSLQKGQLAVFSVNDDATDNEDIPVFSVRKRYADNQTAAHVIGYLNDDHGVSGIEKSYDEFLAQADGKLKVSFSVDAKGRILEGEKPFVSFDEYDVKQGVRLTLDKKIQEIAEKAMDESTIEKGAAVVLEIKSGKIRAMVSRPVFSPNDLSESLKSDGSPFINRALTDYAVGSVFKPVVASAALDNNVSDKIAYTCTGEIQQGNTLFHCHERKGHGTLTMERAIEVSCNPYFINLSTHLNPSWVLETSSLLGLGKKNQLASSIEDSSGVLPDEQELSSSSASFANFSFGQGNFSATPLQMAAVYSAIADNGIYRKPTLIEGTVQSDGVFIQSKEPKNTVTAMEPSTSKTIRRFLEKTVSDGSGHRAKPDKTTAAGKTATAQSGWYENGVEILHTWFAGYFPADNPKYAVVVMNEYGSSGAVDCAPVFKKIADEILKYNK